MEQKYYIGGDMLEISPTPVQILENHWLDRQGIRVLVKRDDLNHPLVMGNKWRKLKYNLRQVREKGQDTLVTYGGAFSNHILATAAAAHATGLNSIGIIRGEELNPSGNPTLLHAGQLGMQLVFVPRGEFRQLKSNLQLPEELAGLTPAQACILPEGGTNEHALRGCREILPEVEESFDICCTAMGTGGTFLGLLDTLSPGQALYGFSALKGAWIKGEIQSMKEKYHIHNDNYQLFEDVFFGGYARFNRNLIQFILDFRQEYNILLDPIYTGKMFFSVWEMIKNDQIARGTTLLMIHTGGLQGIDGFNFRFGLKLPRS